MDATAKLIAVVLLAAFATERILAAVNYLFNAERLFRVRSGAAVKLRAKARRKLILTVLAAVIAAVVVERADLRILRLLQTGSAPPLVDFWLTWLIVFAGADRIRDILGGGDASAASEAPVVQVQIDGGEVQTLQRVS